MFETILKEDVKTDRKTKAILYNKLSLANTFNVKFEKAIAYAKKALDESTMINDNTQKAKAHDNIGNIYYQLRKNLDEALENHQKALEIRLSEDPVDDYKVAVSYRAIGLVLSAQGKFEEAIESYSLGLSKIPDDIKKNAQLRANCFIGQGQALYDIGRFDESLEKMNAAYQTAKVHLGETHHSFRVIYNSLGAVYYYLEQYNLSLQFYKKALALSIKQNGLDHPYQTPFHYNIGSIYVKQGLKEKAIYHIQKTIDLGTSAYGTDHPNFYHPYNLLGQLLENEEGLQYLNKSLAICQKSVGENDIRTATVYNSMAKVHVTMGQLDLALNYAKKSLVIYLKLFGEQNVNVAHGHILLAQIYLEMNNYSKALSSNQKAFDANYRYEKGRDDRTGNYNFSDFENGSLFLNSLRIKGDIYLEKYQESQNLSDLRNSISLYNQSALFISELRKNQLSYDDEIELSRLVKQIYSRNVKVTLLLSQLEQDEDLREKAFDYSELSRAFTLERMVNQKEAKKIANLPDVVLQKEKRIDSLMANVQSELIKLRSTVSADSVQLYSWESKLLEVSLRKDSLETALEQEYPRYFELKYAKNILSVHEIQKNLDDSTSLLEFFKTNTTLYAFVISNETFEVYNLEIPDLDEGVKKLQEIITSKNESKFYKKSNDLYQQIIAPLRKSLKGDRLIIIPDASLWHLPFEVLLSKSYDPSSKQDADYLLKDFGISYTNSASFLFNKLEMPLTTKDIKGDCIAFSYTRDLDTLISLSDHTEALSLRTLRDSKEDLPGTREEIKALSQIFDGQYYFDAQANELNFKKEASKYNIVHLALHGDIDHTNPKNSMLYFSPLQNTDFPEDNILYNHELFALDIPAGLAVLSACNTGTGQLNSGEGIASLGQSFQYAGTKSLLLSRWEVSDKAAPELMKSFYKNLKQGMDKSKALQKAKLDFLSQSDEFSKAPFYWGNFYLLGGASSMEFEKNDDAYWMVFALVLIIIAAVIVKKVSLRRNSS